LTLLFCCIFIILKLCFSYSISALFCISFLTFHILLIFKYFSYPLTIVFAWNFISFWFSSFDFFHFPFWHIISFHTISSFCIQTFKEIPPFYHEQWAPNYPQEVRFKYNGETYPIRVQQHGGRYFFADGLADMKADLKIYESTIINFFVCDDSTIFYLHFTPPLNQQTCGRPILHSRQHIWTTEITQCILGAPQPLVTCNHINLHYYENFNQIINLYKWYAGNLITCKEISGRMWQPLDNYKEECTSSAMGRRYTRPRH